ncbi:MAG: M14 family metallopeptidase [Ignavibacteriales bacterium]|nr:MAG: hypothetical protein F9K26_11560 [Ignavibacteriaceae bacterium]MBW7872643.1 M14 family metallopeptidase [Ignavibacteria bacterium]MCZ2141803.1 M14 family metallopeptidase [Ignavibacteriales bacterium]OQY73460.1 MAG: hypothetical protein B6D45_08135 [Ignavibacteriales bacterium UTCHB3]MBV6444972.1 hypothetical protein [Ignavibacteriaceae bacterium]
MQLFRALFFLLAPILIIYPQKGWETVSEETNFKRTASCDETDEYFNRLSKISSTVRYETFGTSPQGRAMKVFIVSKDTALTPEKAKKSGKPILFIINGIHPAEIEGKEASMIFLREMLVEGKHRQIYDNVILVIVPIFSVDGHERTSPYNRINQNGPENMGWRGTSLNYNLNRDWTKADTPEMQAMLRLFNTWEPDLVMDNHTTDGADFQYTVQYGLEDYQMLAPNIVKLIRNSYLPYLQEKVEGAGFLMCPYFWFREGELEKGLRKWISLPRFTNGYAAAKNRICLLVETHMLKPFNERIFATYECIKATGEFMAMNAKIVIGENRKADNESYSYTGKGANWLPVNFSVSDKTENTFSFKGFEAIKEKSEVSGGEKTVYTKNKKEIIIPHYDDVVVTDSVLLPQGYVIPKEYKEVIEKLALHGVEMQQFTSDTKVKAEVIKFKDVRFDKAPFEGRTRVKFKYDTETKEVTVPAGSFYVRCEGKNFKLIAVLLEPKSEDSFVAWGFFNNIFEMKEYFEDYVMEKVAAEMLAKDPALKKEFNDKLANDKEFSGNPFARLYWFFERSPYFDAKFCVYPILRVVDGGI